MSCVTLGKLNLSELQFLHCEKTERVIVPTCISYIIKWIKTWKALENRGWHAINVSWQRLVFVIMLHISIVVYGYEYMCTGLFPQWDGDGVLHIFVILPSVPTLVLNNSRHWTKACGIDFIFLVNDFTIFQLSPVNDSITYRIQTSQFYFCYSWGSWLLISRLAFPPWTSHCF